MKSEGLLLKEVGGIYLLIGRQPVKSPRLDLRLTFYIISEDTWLMNYSDLVQEHFNEAFFLHNRSDKQRLHTHEMISEEDKMLVFDSFSGLDALVLDHKAQVEVTQHLEGKVVFSGTYFHFKAVFTMAELSSLGALKIEGVQLSTPLVFYAVTVLPKKLFGILDLHIYAATEELAYSAFIGAKPILWRYYLVNKQSLTFKDFVLYSGKSKLDIKDDALAIIGTGDQAYVIETANTIPIAEKYEYFYELEFVKEDPKTGQVLSRKRIGLPIPEVSKIKIPQKASGKEAYSDMYIYL
ncbi:MAG TPA: hypothetical protein VL947_02370 [Cytophagales bacterium]|nr:hypothetical protein [Cytophagales bacterium]